jgi:hypothetical protein
MSGAPLFGIWTAMVRKTDSGETLAPEERITVEEAIRMCTINGAYSSFEEKIKGSIEPGKLADLVVLSDDPLSVPTDKIKDIVVEMTIIGGRVVYARESKP